MSGPQRPDGGGPRMRDEQQFTAQDIRYLQLLRKQYRTIQEASAEVAHLRA